jgi:hypothetical protein
MIFFITRYRNHHRPAPVQGAFVVRCKNADDCALSQLNIMAIHFDTRHQSSYIISQTDLIALPNGRVIIQIPIARRLI